MNDPVGEALEKAALSDYERQVARIEKMESAAAREAALRIIKKLAGLRFHYE